MGLEKLQLLCFEISNTCNLSKAHSWCPSCVARFPDRSTKPNIKQMLNFLDVCIRRGFVGGVAYHYYNEPTSDLIRCKELNDGVKERNLKSILWTNGTYKNLEELNEIFDEIYITQYEENKNCDKEIPYKPDDRLTVYNIDEKLETRPCHRPELIELVVDYHGFLHICCADWKEEVKIGNICKDNHEEILNNFERIRDEIKNNELPSVCKRCQNLNMSPALYQNVFKI